MNNNELDSLQFFTSNDRAFNQRRWMEDPRLSKMLQIAAKKNRILSSEITPQRYYWDDRRFHLHTSTTFKELSFEMKEDILEQLSNHSVTTSYFIEKSAITYCAKMALIAETFDEKMLYIQIGHEEVIHFLEFEVFLKASHLSEEATSPFTQMINELIQNNGREISFLIAQVLLEGMAIHHYTQLRESCNHEDMKKVIEQVLHDEARHHGSGLILLDNVHLSQEMVDQMVMITKKLIPILKRQKEVLQQILVASSLTVAQAEKILQEINIDQQMEDRVGVIENGLRKLKNSNLKESLLQAMES